MTAHHPPPATREDGFSLVEVLVATAILASALAALGQVFTFATRASIEARDTTSETIFAAQKIEEFRATAFRDQEQGESVEYLDISGRITGGAVTVDGPSAFTRRWTIAPFPADPTNVAMISVTVSKHQPGPSTRRAGVHLVSLKTRKGQ